MNEDNKNRMGYGLKVVALALCALITIIVCVGIWNNAAHAEGIQIAASILLFLCNAGLIISAGRAASKKYNDTIDELAKKQDKRK